MVDQYTFATVLVALVSDATWDIAKFATLRDEVDDAAGIALTEEYGGRSFDDLDTFYVVKIMRDVAKHTVTHDVVNLETAHRETTLRGVLVSRYAHAAEAGITRGGRRVPEQIGQRAGVGIFEEFFGKHRDIQRYILNFHADASRGD